MFIVVVQIQVKPEFIELFAEAAKINAEESFKEPGVAGFDVLQQIDDPTRFVLYEMYYAPEGQLAHRETQHYQHWRDTVAEWMAVPRVGTKYISLFQDDE